MEGRIRRVCAARERVRRSGTAGSRGQRDRDVRPGASAGSGGQKDRGRCAAGVARVEMMMMNGEKKKKEQRPKGWTAAARKDGIVLSRSRPAWRDHGTWCHQGR